MTNKLNIVEVTFTVKYAVPEGLNGWTHEQIMDDWFKNHSLNSRHASRDAYEIGNSKKIVGTKLVEEV